MSGFKLFQMDVKSTFLNGFINGEVYVSQPTDFEDHKHLEHVHKLKKALILWSYKKLQNKSFNNFHLSQNYERRKVDKTFYLERKLKYHSCSSICR